MKHFLLTAALTVVAMLIPAIARADCGAHALKANAPTLLAIEALPLTYENVTWENGPRRADTIVYNQPCPDDSEAMQIATEETWDLWRDAIKLQDDIAMLGYISQGKVTNQSPLCVDVYKDKLRDDILNRWGYIHNKYFAYHPTHAVRVARIHAFESAPYYGHIVGLWQSLAAQMAIALPPIDGTAPNPYLKRSMTEQAHLPGNTYCPAF